MGKQWLVALLCGTVASIVYVVIAQALSQRTSREASGSAANLSGHANEPARREGSGAPPKIDGADGEEQVEYVYLRKQVRIKTISHGEKIDLRSFLPPAGKTIIEFTASW